MQPYVQERRMKAQPEDRSAHGFKARGPTSHLLALPLVLLAVKPIIQAARVVALRVTLAIIEVLPALQRLRAVLPGVIEIERAVTAIPATGVVVALPIADLIACIARTNSDLTLLLNFGWDDVLPEAAWEIEVEDVAVEAVEVGGAVAVVVRGGIAEELAGAPVVAGVGDAGAAGWVLALRAREGCCTHALGALVHGDAGATIQAVQGPAGVGVVLAGGTHKALGRGQQGGVSH